MVVEYVSVRRGANMTKALEQYNVNLQVGRF